MDLRTLIDSLKMTSFSPLTLQQLRRDRRNLILVGSPHQAEEAEADADAEADAEARASSDAALGRGSSASPSIAIGAAWSVGGENRALISAILALNRT